MPAEYIVLEDKTIKLKSGQEWSRDPELPTTAARKQQAILWFMVGADDPDDLKWHVEIDGTTFLDLKTNSSVQRGWHEIVDLQLPPNVITVTFKVDGGDGTLKVSDVVLFFQNTV